jgi:hypothetical protein
MHYTAIRHDTVLEYTAAQYNVIKQCNAMLCFVMLHESLHPTVCARSISHLSAVCCGGGYDRGRAHDEESACRAMREYIVLSEMD